MSFLRLENNGLLLLEGEDRIGYSDYLLLELEDALNTDATRQVPTHYNVCAVSGFKARPHELVKDEYSGEMVLPEFADQQHQQPRSLPVRPSIVQRAEPRHPKFITDRVLPEDL